MLKMIWSFLLIYLLHSVHGSFEPCVTVGQLKADAEKCENFYQCSHNGWVPLHCPSGLVFDSEISVCGWPKPGSMCGGDTDQYNISGHGSCQIVGELKAEEKNCDRFYQCTRFGWTQLTCGHGLTFNPENLVCDWPKPGLKCGGNTNAGNSNQDDDDDSLLEICVTVGQLKADAENCERFYQCTLIGWAPVHCQAGFFYNPKSVVCDLSKPGTKCEQANGNDELESCETVGELKSDEKNCQNFYQCTNGGWVKLNCPDGLFFNTDISVCDRPKTGAKCGNEEDRSCEILGELKEEEQNCDRFYQCTRFGWTQLTCGHGLTFNAENSVCDWPKPGLKCGGNTNTNSGNNDKNQDDDSMLEICETVGEVKADAENCERFYQCTRIGWAPVYCQESFYFNQKLSVCDRSETGAKCGEADHDDDDDSKLVPCDNLGELKSDGENCQNFYQCTNNGWKQLICPDGLFFNPKINVCAWPKPGSKCESANDSGNDEGTNLEPCEKVGQVKADTKHCDLHYLCTSCGWSLKPCESGLLFNPKTSVCDRADRVTCATEDDQPLEPCDNVGELKSDPKNCNKYYHCTTYGWQNMPCYGTLVFNPNELICDYPENVRCGIKSN